MKCNKKARFLVILGVVLSVLGIVLCMQGGKEQGILRQEPGEGTLKQELLAEVDGKEYPLVLAVEERAYKKKEEEQWMKQAKQEIDNTFLGENKALERIYYPVCMKQAYCEERVDARWTIEPGGMINRAGKYLTKDIPKKGKIMRARVSLSCGTTNEEYNFCFHVYPPKLTMKQELQLAIKTAERQDIEKKEIELPIEIGEKKIRWKREKQWRWLLLPLIVPFGIAVKRMRKREEIRKNQKKRELILQISYPQIVHSLSLLIGAGLTVSKAWERVVTQYKKGGKKDEAYEEMYYTWMEIKEGTSEREAYQHFAVRCELSSYKKMVSLLTQNLRKGSSSLEECLKVEANHAMQQRKNMARKLGEEAGTKMLFPMLLLFGIIMVIVITPAITEF